MLATCLKDGTFSYLKVCVIQVTVLIIYCHLKEMSVIT